MSNPVRSLLDEQVDAATRDIEALDIHISYTRANERANQLDLLTDLKSHYHELLEKLRTAHKFFR